MYNDMIRVGDLYMIKTKNEFVKEIWETLKSMPLDKREAFLIDNADIDVEIIDILEVG